jgi:hypothetical protein
MQGFDIAGKYQNPVSVCSGFVQVDGTKWPHPTLSKRLTRITFVTAFTQPPGNITAKESSSNP